MNKIYIGKLSNGVMVAVKSDRLQLATQSINTHACVTYGEDVIAVGVRLAECMLNWVHNPYLLHASRFDGDDFSKLCFQPFIRPI